MRRSCGGCEISTMRINGCSITSAPSSNLLDLTGEDRFGIVVDADHPKAADPDDGFRRRWVQVSENLRNLGYSDVPEEPDPSGTIVGVNQSDRPWVGIWMMPDNRSPGKLEDFAQRLVKAGDEGLWEYAGQAAAGAPSQGAGSRPRTRPRPMFTHFSPGTKCRASRWAWPSPRNSSMPTRPTPAARRSGCAASTGWPAPGSPRREGTTPCPSPTAGYIIV